MMYEGLDVDGLLEEYGPIVRKIAHSARYSSSALDINDLYQVGNVAVLRAVSAYDPSHGMSIKSFVARTIRRDVYNEAARFLGVFTVDFRTTALASKARQFNEQGLKTLEIAERLSESSGRNISESHVIALLSAYEKRHTQPSEDDRMEDPGGDEIAISNLISSVINNEIEQHIVNRRIMGTDSAKDVASDLSVSVNKVYEIEAALKERIQFAIQEAV